MGDFKGTPGPWGFEHNSASGDVTFCINVIANGVSEVCYLQSDEEYVPNRAHTVANANLISAAPELLEALQLLMSEQSGGDKSCGHNGFTCTCPYDKAKAAIAKALGQ